MPPVPLLTPSSVHDVQRGQQAFKSFGRYLSSAPNGRPMMTAYWFRPQRNGDGGLTPTTWQGWAVTLGIPLAMVAVCILVAAMVGAVWLTMAIVLPIDALGLVALMIIAQRKTEGECAEFNVSRKPDGDRRGTGNARFCQLHEFSERQSQAARPQRVIRRQCFAEC